MTSNNHDTLVYRLAQMLVKLNQGEKLDPHTLAEEFGVNLRTIQRDLNERFAYLPLQKTDGRYSLDHTFLGKLNTRDIERFASLAGVRGLFPSLSDDFLRDIFDTRIQSALLIKGHHYENLAGKENTFRLLEQAIIARRHITVDAVSVEVSPAPEAAKKACPVLTSTTRTSILAKATWRLLDETNPDSPKVLRPNSVSDPMIRASTPTKLSFVSVNRLSACRRVMSGLSKTRYAPDSVSALLIRSVTCFPRGSSCLSRSSDWP